MHKKKSTLQKEYRLRAICSMVFSENATSHQVPYNLGNVNGTFLSRKSYIMGEMAGKDFFPHPGESPGEAEKKEAPTAIQPQRLVLK
tara:strand:+ start:495 stop:755 length:261 start_codon:yes stop_codon:yes gene_type:complete